LILTFVIASAVSDNACDLCGCFTPQVNAMSQMEPGHLLSWVPGLYGAVAEQFTYFGTLQIEGDKIGNPAGQYLTSSITQFVAGYDFTDRFSFQINVP